MQTAVFIIGFIVSIMVVFGIFSLVPKEFRPPK